MPQEDQKYILESTSEDVGKRLDIFLSEKTNFTRSKIKKLVENKAVYKIINSVKQQCVSLSYKVKENEQYEMNNYIAAENDIKPVCMDLDIIYEDQDLLIINKPVNLPVHPGAGNVDNTLVNGLLYHYKNNLSLVNGSLRAGIVHRLDKDTSGILVVAKNDDSHVFLAKQFENRTINRKYRGLVWGSPKFLQGKISTHIARDRNNRLKMTVSKSRGKNAITNYKVINVVADANLSLIEMKLETGRTHQIRVHMNYLQHSLVGDPLYNDYKAKYYSKISESLQASLNIIKHQMLHAYKLGFVHPRSKEYIEFNQKEPDYILEIYEMLGIKL